MDGWRLMSLAIVTSLGEMVWATETAQQRKANTNGQVSDDDGDCWGRHGDSSPDNAPLGKSRLRPTTGRGGQPRHLIDSSG